MFPNGNAIADEVTLHFSNSKIHSVLAFESLRFVCLFLNQTTPFPLKKLLPKELTSSDYDIFGGLLTFLKNMFSLGFVGALSGGAGNWYAGYAFSELKPFLGDTCSLTMCLYVWTVVALRN